MMHPDPHIHMGQIIRATKREVDRPLARPRIPIDNPALYRDCEADAEVSSALRKIEHALFVACTHGAAFLGGIIICALVATGKL